MCPVVQAHPHIEPEFKLYFSSYFVGPVDKIIPQNVRLYRCLKGEMMLSNFSTKPNPGLLSARLVVLMFLLGLSLTAQAAATDDVSTTGNDNNLGHSHRALVNHPARGQHGHRRRHRERLWEEFTTRL